MSAKIMAVEGRTARIEVIVDLKDSLLDSEEAILEAFNAGGVLATREALQRFDTDGQPLVVAGQKYFSKGRLSKVYQTPYGEVDMGRHVYQSAHGGKTFCPLEQRARIVVASTPRFARMVSYHYAWDSGRQVSENLQVNHGRAVAPSFVQRLSEAVGAVVQAREEEGGNYHLPPLDQPVATVAIGLDGTCVLLCQDGWREAMTGTLSFYDGQGERLHTIYLGVTPEYGKARFYTRLEQEIAQAKARYPTARYVGIADGAKSNWRFLDAHVSDRILDFYHVAEYVARAAPAVEPKDLKARTAWQAACCHALKHDSGAAAKLLAELEGLPTHGLTPPVIDALEATLTYLRNHLDQMEYARYRDEHLPIGSGVTEAACKTLIKHRLCASGMRWKDTGAAVVLSLRALVLTPQRWSQFWERFNRYGFDSPRLAANEITRISKYPAACGGDFLFKKVWQK